LCYIEILIIFVITSVNARILFSEGEFVLSVPKLEEDFQNLRGVQEVEGEF